MKILLAEDEKPSQKYIVSLLEKSGYDVDAVDDGNSATTRGIDGHYDVIVLDIAMPYKDGFEVCQELRANGVTSPVLFLTSFDGTDDVVHGLELGGDDYLAKPFNAKELIARITALSRRMPDMSQNLLEVNNWKINRATLEVSYKGELIDVRKKEYSLLLAIALKPDKTFTREELLTTVWGVSPISSSNRVDAFVKIIRKKTDKDAIYTVSGLGYKMTK